MTAHEGSWRAQNHVALNACSMDGGDLDRPGAQDARVIDALKMSDSDRTRVLLAIILGCLYSGAPAEGWSAVDPVTWVPTGNCRRPWSGNQYKTSTPGAAAGGSVRACFHPGSAAWTACGDAAPAAAPMAFRRQERRRDGSRGAWKRIT